MPHVFDRRNYVRYGFGRNIYCDSGDRVARATRVKRGLERSSPGFQPPSSCAHGIVTEWPTLHSLDRDGSATLQAMSTHTIPEYLEEERQKATDTQLRTEVEAARIQALQRGRHRTAKQPKLELLPPVKAATKKKKRTVAVAHRKPRASGKMAEETRKRA
jgi:hypothetical protein